MSEKTEGDVPEGDVPVGDVQVYHINSIPQSLLAEYGKPNSNALSTSKVLLKSSARGIENNFDNHNKKLMNKKGNAPARLMRVVNLKRAMMSDPNRDWSTAIKKIAADLENFHVDVSSILVAGKKQLLVTMTFDPVSLKRINTTIADLLHDLAERNFAVERTLPLSDLNSKAVIEIIEAGRFSIAMTHSEITEEEHLRSDNVAKLSRNGATNAGEASINTLRNRELPKVGFVSEQKLTKAKAKMQRKEYETTTHPTIDSIGLKGCEQKKLQNDLVAFQQNGFKETTVTVNSKRKVTIKLFPWNRFDLQGRSASDRAITGKKRKA